MYKRLSDEMTEYYRKADMNGWLDFADEDFGKRFVLRYDGIFSEMDEIYRNDPDIPVCLLKSRLHRVMAEQCEPILFLESPFFFELDCNHSRSRGLNRHSPSYWLVKTKKQEMFLRHAEYADAEKALHPYFDRETNNLCSHYDTFDHDHNSLGYTELLDIGIGGIMKKAADKRLTLTDGSREYTYLTSVMESCDAIIHLAERFSHKAETLIDSCENDAQRENMKLVARTAKRIPKCAPETFYEGLVMILFMREVTSAFENIGISQLGHVDLLLAELYERDISDGRLTEDEARRLVTLWMMHTDIKFDVKNNKWPESSACIQLGGCNADGDAVFNDLTRVFIEEHHRWGLISPKLNCRVSENSCAEYLELIGKAVLGGHNCFALFNDDTVIPSLVKSGVSARDARMYVNGGCQEMMLEGFGHTEGTAFYISLLRFFDVFLRGDDSADMIKPVGKPESFEEFYKSFVGAFDEFFEATIENRNFRQSFYEIATAYPLYSAMQDGCIEACRDVINGGAKYNFSTVALVGFTNVADSLYAVKELVYDRKRLTLDELRSVLASNWQTSEALRKEAAHLEKFGHGESDVDALANRCLTDISDIIKSRKNARGGKYLPSIFVYSFNRTFAPCLRATPDGRYDFEYLAPGSGPSAVKPVRDITGPVNSQKNADFGQCTGVAVLDLMLPSVVNFDIGKFSAFVRACCQSGCVAVQPNAVTYDALVDAKKYPERYRDLIVRVCGLSAYFTALAPDVQDELIQRHFYDRI